MTVASQSTTRLVRAVLDTSVLVPSTLRRDLQEASALGLYTALWSPWIIAELNRVLVWRWIKKPPANKQRGDLSAANERLCAEMAKRMMARMLPTFELVSPLPPYPPAWPELSDHWDHPVWAAAVLGNARYVVSNNSRHFPPRQDDGRHVFQGIEYVRGRVFLDAVLGIPSRRS
jgi:hypothetical protein